MELDERENESAASAVWLDGEGEMRARIRNFDWASTSLGALPSWPDELRVALGICLEAGFPSCIYWGPDAIHLYNDKYAQMLRRKHSFALGRGLKETWPERAAELQVIVDEVLAGRTVFAENQP